MAAVPDDLQRRTNGDLLIVRPPVPARCFKSEVTHLEHAPRRAYDEWLSICDAIVACGGDAVYRFEAVDDPYLDHAALEVDGDGDIRPAGAREVLGNMRDVHTGRVFTANGPWTIREDGKLRAVVQHMLPARAREVDYHRELLGALADAAGLGLELTENPHRWEGKADVTVVGDQVILTYAVRGHYDESQQARSPRSTREGVSFAADHAGVPESARVYAELVYPHGHGDTVQFAIRPAAGPPVLVHYPGGLWGDGHDRVVSTLGRDRVVSISIDDAVHQFAGNSRQVKRGVLIPDGVSPRHADVLQRFGLTTHRVVLFELFGKTGGGPACATLPLPSEIDLPAGSPLRYSATRMGARARRSRIAERLTVSPEYFQTRSRT